MKNLFSSFLKLLFLIAIVSVFSIKGYSQNKSVPKTEAELLKYLDEREKLYEKYITDLGLQYWNYYAQEGKYELVNTKKNVSDFFKDKDFKATIKEWTNKKASVKDSILRRRLELWTDLIKGAELNLVDDVMNLQSRIEDSITERNQNNSRKSWKQVDDLTIKLVKLRNEKARSLGYKDYGQAVIDLSGLDTSFFYKAVEIIDLLTYAPYKKLVDEYKANQKSYTLYSFYNLFGKYQSATDNISISGDSMKYYMRKTFNDIGIDFDKLPITTFIEKNLAPPMGGQGIAVKIPDDFRIVVLPTIDFGSRMHELGHGINFMSIRAASPVLKGYEWLLGGESPTFGEGMAETMRAFVDSPEWLKKYMKKNPDSLAKKEMLAKKYFPVYIRYYLSTFMVEMEMYKNPDQDLKALNNKIMTKYLLLDEGSFIPYELTNAYIISYPVYMHNYMFAEIIAWQVHKALREKFGDNYMFDKRTGKYLIDMLYKDGEYFSLEKRLLNATGKKMDYVQFIKEHKL